MEPGHYLEMVSYPRAVTPKFFQFADHLDVMLLRMEHREGLILKTTIGTRKTICNGMYVIVYHGARISGKKTN
jgi:hypothetical protein